MGRIPVREEIIEDNAGVISLVVVPTLVSGIDEEEASNEGSNKAMSPADN